MGNLLCLDGRIKNYFQSYGRKIENILKKDDRAGSSTVCPLFCLFNRLVDTRRLIYVEREVKAMYLFTKPHMAAH